MPYYIGPEGPKTAKLAIVAEKPGRDELRALLETGSGRPLIGSSGKDLDRFLIRAGSHRSQVYLTNSVKTFDALGNPTTEEIKNEQITLYKELLSLPNLNCIIAMGKAALLSLSNFQLGGIQQWRGSVIPSFIRKKMVPCFHPSFYMHGEWRFKPIVEHDIRRALAEAEFPEIKRKTRHYYVEPTFAEAKEWLCSFIGKKEISFDVEGYRFINCIAFSSSPEEAFCIPLCRGDRTPYWSVQEEVEIWRLIQLVLQQKEVCYVTQYGLSDCWKLWRHGIVTPFMFRGFDTMYAHRLLATDLPHTLEFLVSLYTDEYYYKDEAGDWLGSNPVPDRQFWTYNGKDAALTLECKRGIEEELKEKNLFAYFMEEMQARFNSVLRTQEIGIKVDKARLVEIRRQLYEDLTLIKGQMNEHIGWIPNTRSKLDMKKFFDQFSIRYEPTKTGKAKSNEEYMLKYAARSSEAAQQAIGLCLEVSRRETLVSNFFHLRLDRQDFYHPSLDLSHAKTGRDSSKGSEEGGPQIQNIPEFAKIIFIPDTSSHIFIQADQKQAEAMYVAWDAEDELLINTFLEKKDIHRVFACILFRDWTAVTVPPDEMLASISEVCNGCAKQGQKKCNHSERYMGKQTGHASSYKEGPRRLVVEFAKKGVFITESQAKEFLARIVSPAKRLWQERVKHDLAKSAWLENPLGRRKEFYGILDDKMVRDALSWLAQSTVSSITNRAWNFLDRNLPRGSRLVTNTHDSILVCAESRHESGVLSLFDEAFYCPMRIHGRELIIPIEKTVGENWREMR